MTAEGFYKMPIDACEVNKVTSAREEITPSMLADDTTRNASYSGVKPTPTGQQHMSPFDVVL